MGLDNIRNERNQNQRHFENFRQAMKPLLIWGQYWGLVPVTGVTEKNPSNVRFRLGSLRFYFSLFMSFFDAMYTCLFIYVISSYSNDISNIVLLIFYSSNCFVTVLSMMTAYKWPMLAKEVSSSNLDVHPRIRKKCTWTLLIFVGIALLEYIVAVISDIAHVLDCLNFDEDIFGGYIETRFAILFILGLPYHFTIGIILQYLAVRGMVTWNYSDLFIICISFYLTSVLEEVNEKIKLASTKSLPSSAWRELREAYTRATRLVRIFDNAINHVTFVSFTTSLFFVLLKLFFVLTQGLNGRSDADCPNFPSGPFYGYEQSIYFVISLFTVLLRAISVPLIAAQVFCESKSALPALYRIPTKNYCYEVQRLIEQIHGDTVTLTGSNFFGMTRDLVLTVTGTIITYELVLLQFKGKEINAKLSYLKNLNDPGSNSGDFISNITVFPF